MDSNSRLARLRERLKRDNDRRVYPALARLLWDSGDNLGALALLDTGEKAHPDYVPMLMVSAHLRHSAGDTEAAVERYRRVVRLDPGNLVALQSLADSHLQSGQPDKAREIYGRILKIDPDNEAAAEALAEIDGDLAAGDGRSGTIESEESEDDFPGLRPTETMAELYAEQGAPQKAAAVYRKLLRGDPANARWRERLSRLEDGIGT